MLITVASFRDPWEAHLFRTRLEVEGIPAFVVHPYHIGANWPWSLALGGVKVQVLDEEVREARAVFERCIAGEFRAELRELFGDLDEPRCPKCGAQDYSQRRPNKEIVMTVPLILLGFPIPAVGWRRHCQVCGTVWQED